MQMVSTFPMSESKCMQRIETLGMCGVVGSPVIAVRVRVLLKYWTAGGKGG